MYTIIERVYVNGTYVTKETPKGSLYNVVNYILKERCHNKIDGDFVVETRGATANVWPVGDNEKATHMIKVALRNVRLVELLESTKLPGSILTNEFTLGTRLVDGHGRVLRTFDIDDDYNKASMLLTDTLLGYTYDQLDEDWMCDIVAHVRGKLLPEVSVMFSFHNEGRILHVTSLSLPIHLTWDMPNDYIGSTFISNIALDIMNELYLKKRS